MSTKYMVLIGLDYGKKRCEPGDVASDIPSVSVPWLLEQGAIKPLEPEAEARVLLDDRLQGIGLQLRHHALVRCQRVFEQC